MDDVTMADVQVAREIADEESRKPSAEDRLTGGTRRTLEPIRTIDISIPIHEVESTLAAGFRIEWVDGEINGAPFSLNVGAGCGSPWGTIDFDGRDFCFNVRDLVDAFAKALQAADAARANVEALTEALAEDPE